MHDDKPPLDLLSFVLKGLVSSVYLYEKCCRLGKHSFCYSLHVWYVVTISLLFIPDQIIPWTLSVPPISLCVFISVTEVSSWSVRVCVLQLKGLSSTLEAEKASRADLELYTAILNTQKTALTDDVDRLRAQLTELRQVSDRLTSVPPIYSSLPMVL